MKKYQHIAVGGTFDRFHKGHRELLKTAFAAGKRVSVGITDDVMVKEKQLWQTILPHTKRKADVEDYLAGNGWDVSANIVRLTDPLGPLSTDPSIDAVVVGPRTTKGALEHLPSRIDVLRCKTILADDGEHLSSTRIRWGEIDREGGLFDIPRNDLALSEHVRSVLKKPLGILGGSYRKNPDSLMIVSVGDVTTKRLLEKGIVPSIGVVDFYVQRKKTYASLSDIGYSEDVLKQHGIAVHAIKNPAGTIYRNTFVLMKQLLHAAVSGKKSVVIVDGEDDLVTLAALYHAPLATMILYGQPNEGLVEVRVTEERKAFGREIIETLMLTSTSSL